MLQGGYGCVYLQGILKYLVQQWWCLICHLFPGQARHAQSVLITVMALCLIEILLYPGIVTERYTHLLAI